MFVLLIISVLGRVLADPNVDITTETVASQIDSTVSSGFSNFTEGITSTNDGQTQRSGLDGNLSLANTSQDSVEYPNDNPFGKNETTEQNTPEVYQNDEKAELNNDDELHKSTDGTTTTEEEGEHIDWLDNGNDEFTTDSELPGENFNDTVDGTFNGSDNETAEGVFDNSDNTDGPFDGIDESLFNTSNNETADDIFNNSHTATAEDVFNKLNHDIFNDTFNIPTNETSSPSSTNLSGILQAWLSERANVTSEPYPMPVTKPYLGPIGDGSLFLGALTNGQGDVCISLNISMQPVLNGTPLQLSHSHGSTESYAMNNGSIAFHATDNDKAYNVTTEFLIHCYEKSCGVELVSVDVRNSTNRQAVVLHTDLSISVNLGTTFEDISKRTLNVTDEIQLEISYISVFVSENCGKLLTAGNFFVRHYVEITCGVGVLVIAACLTFFILRKIQRRKKNSFDTMM
ncbi:hypothetical protein PPYR_07925 [Photinus pyralis]|uniref:ZP domain-containing protein n=1 Tax=Photinus pyralis TaxID=7054 RepID=A0A1Y1KMR6_PHOPY|nr:uncharacterized protein LOC116168651 [Photinus pyralis]XP_031340731.1 uncharacterized protein LOC116168875 [Photinus pyralis]KAB0800045.1 hypothetical protein PPYR_07925 [Photinus pyralis]